MKKYATCNIFITPTLSAQPTRRRTAEVCMNICAGLQAGPSTEPIKLVIKGENFERVMELMTLNRKTDEALAKAARGSELASDVEGMTVEETAAWVRQNVIDELREMAQDGEQEADSRP